MNTRIPVLICALALSATAFAADPKPAVPATPATPAAAATPGMGQQGHPDEHMQSMMKECMARQGEERKACQDKMKAEHMKSMDGMKGMKGDMKGMQGGMHDDHAATPATTAAPATPAMPSDHDHKH